jgi:hypothetical protein
MRTEASSRKADKRAIVLTTSGIGRLLARGLGKACG